MIKIKCKENKIRSFRNTERKPKVILMKLSPEYMKNNAWKQVVQEDL